MIIYKRRKLAILIFSDKYIPAVHKHSVNIIFNYIDVKKTGLLRNSHSDVDLLVHLVHIDLKWDSSRKVNMKIYKNINQGYIKMFEKKF